MNQTPLQQPLPQNRNSQQEIEKQEEGITYLPDLYIRKFRLVERFRDFRPRYYGTNYVENKRLKRPLSQWDLILEEMKFRHLEIKEEQKFKQAQAYQLAKRIKRDVTKNMYKKDEIQLQLACTGSILQICILNAFDDVNNFSSSKLLFIEQKSKAERKKEEAELKQKIKEEKEREKLEKEKQLQLEKEKEQANMQDVGDFLDIGGDDNVKQEENNKQDEGKIEIEEQKEVKVEQVKESPAIQVEEIKAIKLPKVAKFILGMIEINKNTESDNQEPYKGLGQVNLEKKIELYKQSLKEIQTRNGSSKRRENNVSDPYPQININNLIKPRHRIQHGDQINKIQEQADQQKQHMEEEKQLQLQKEQDLLIKSETMSTVSQFNEKESNISESQQNSTTNIPNIVKVEAIQLSQENQQQLSFDNALQKQEIEKVSGVVLLSKYLDTTKKRKKKDDSNKEQFSDEFMQQATKMNPNLELKKSKYENVHELLSLYYDANALNDTSEFQKAFEKTIQNHKEFGKTFEAIEELPVLPPSYIHVNKGCLFDNEYEDFINDNLCNITGLLSNYEKNLQNHFPVDKILLSKEQEEKLTQRNVKINGKQLIASNLLNQNQKKLSFVYVQKKFDIITDTTMRQIVASSSRYHKSNFVTPIVFQNFHFYYLIEQAIKLWGSVWSFVSHTINNHPLCRGFYLSDKICEAIYIDMLQKKRTKVIDLHHNILPTTQNFLELKMTNSENDSKMMKEDEQEYKQQQYKNMYNDRFSRKHYIAEEDEDEDLSVDEMVEKFRNKKKENSFKKAKKQLSFKVKNNFNNFKQENTSLFSFLEKQNKNDIQIIETKRFEAMQKKYPERNLEGIKEKAIETKTKTFYYKHPVFSIVNNYIRDNSKPLPKKQFFLKTKIVYNDIDWQTNLAQAQQFSEEVYKGKELLPSNFNRRKKVQNEKIIPMLAKIQEYRTNYINLQKQKMEQQRLNPQYYKQQQYEQQQKLQQQKLQQQQQYQQQQHQNEKNYPNQPNSGPGGPGGHGGPGGPGGHGVPGVPGGPGGPGGPGYQYKGGPPGSNMNQNPPQNYNQQGGQYSQNRGVQNQNSPGRGGPYQQQYHQGNPNQGPPIPQGGHINGNYNGQNDPQNGSYNNGQNSGNNMSQSNIQGGISSQSQIKDTGKKEKKKRETGSNNSKKPTKKQLLQQQQQQQQQQLQGQTQMNSNSNLPQMDMTQQESNSQLPKEKAADKRKNKPSKKALKKQEEQIQNQQNQIENQNMQDNMKNNNDPMMQNNQNQMGNYQMNDGNNQGQMNDYNFQN